MSITQVSALKVTMDIYKVMNFILIAFNVKINPFYPIKVLGLKKYYLALIILLTSLFFMSCVHSNDSIDYALGEVNQQDLLTDYESFAISYQEFAIEIEQKKQVEQWPSNLKVDVYFATWCHDSEREVPHLLKALQKNNQIKVMLLALDYQKSEPKGRAKKANVKYTPTFVVSLAGKELGRIIERPIKSLVDDITAMLKNNNKIK